MKKIYCLLATAILAVGCTADVTTDNGVVNNEANYEYVEVVADLEIDEESRTTLTDGGQGGKVVWSANDAIGAVLEDNTVVECVATSVNGSSATFPVPATTKYAIYPYTADYVADFGKNRIGHRFMSNTTLDGSAQVFGDKQNVMVAALSDGKLPFKHVCGFIEVKLKGTGTVKHVALRSNTRKWDALSGLAYISFSALPEPTAAFSTGYNAASNWIYATCSDVELSKSEAKSFYFVVPPRTYENLSICVQTENGSYAISSQNAITVNRAKIRPIAAIDIDTVKPATATDLSAEGLANCYIVPEGSEAKYYSFPAQRINAATKLENVAYAHILWSDRAKLITDVNYDAATGTVSFKYAGGNAEGNAMVSVFNAEHNALWTWHIWCTDQPEVVAIKNRTNPTNKTHRIMDRNLGATYAPKSVAEATSIDQDKATAAMGLYYQYGRPIPFPKAKSITSTADEATNARFGANSDCELMYGFYNQLQSFQFSNNSANTLSSMLANPLIYSVVSGSFCKDLPQTIAENIKIWYTENADVVSKKGDTDPCPAGYCVDDKNTFATALWGSFNIVESDVVYGHYYQCPTTGNVAYLPANGHRTLDGVYSSVGSTGSLWCPLNDSPTNDRFLAYKLWVEGTPKLANGSSQRAYGFGVRCRVLDRTSAE